METVESFASQIRGLNWSQCVFIPEVNNSLFLNENIDLQPNIDDDQYRLVVVTHVCDLVRDIIREPYVEVIVCLKIGSRDAVFSYGRNPRKLHLATTNGECFEFDIHSRFRGRKELLLECQPDDATAFSEKEVLILRNWIARRYLRQPFPDEFNNRVVVNKKRIKKLLREEASRKLSCIYIAGVDGELASDEDYSITILLVAQERNEDDFLYEERIEECFGDCPGIAINDIMTITEDELTIGMLREYIRYDTDFYSQEISESVITPPEDIDTA